MSQRVLIIDDDADLRILLRAYLQAVGFIVVDAHDGPTGLALLADEGFDAVLLDMVMPGLSGIDVLARIRERHALTQLPVLMLTGRAASADRVALMS